MISRLSRTCRIVRLTLLFYLFFPSLPAMGKEGIQRGVSWVAFGRPITENDLLPLVSHNVNWIVQTPFGWQQNYNSTTIRLNTDPDHAGWGESDLGISETARLARKVGIKTLLKPHIWLINRSDGKWRGDVKMDDESGWTEWFESYGDFILHYARLAEATDIEALCVGMELHTCAVEREKDWRKLIAAVREVYSGKLVYGANWHREFEEIPFWDALDFIGIQAYFPLTKKEKPSVDELVKGWTSHLSAIERLQDQHQKPVLITEIGYHSAVDAAIKPWEWKRWDSAPADKAGYQTQANCYEAFFRTFWDKTWFAGVYFWKWYPDYRRIGARYARDYTPQGKQAGEVMRKWFECE